MPGSRKVQVHSPGSVSLVEGLQMLSFLCWFLGGNRRRQMRGYSCSVISNARASLGGCLHFQSWTAAVPALMGTLGEEFLGEEKSKSGFFPGRQLHPAEEMRQGVWTLSVLIGEERQCFREPAA